jgi:MoaA/NifB/PqqE/SkfB family radical SAM enzyme
MLKYLKLAERVLLVSSYRKFGFPFVMPYKYIFIITNLCQSKCRTCNIWKIYKKRPSELKKELKLQDYEKIFENIKDEVFWLNFSGGEPFLRKDLVEMTKLAFKKFKNLIIFNMPTNGLETEIIKKEVEKILKFKRDDIKFFITISLDGPEDLHDKIRGIKGSYKKARKTYDELKQLSKKYKNFFVSFQSTLSKYNIERYKDVFEELKNTSLPIIAFSAEADYFNNIGSGIKLQNVEKKKILKAIRYFHENYPDSLESLILKKYLDLAEEFYKNPKKLVLPCFASFATITVDAYGNVKPCAYFSESIGNVKDFNLNLKNVLKSDKARRLKKMVKQGKCVHCWANCEAYPSIIQNFFRK